MNRLSLVVVPLAVAVWIASRPDDAVGCGGAYRPGERVDVADETALIVWDAKTRTQHFIRRATFLSTAYDFGFLVPTPNRPQLAESSDDLFADLAAITAPALPPEPDTSLPPLPFSVCRHEINDSEISRARAQRCIPK